MALPLDEYYPAAPYGVNPDGSTTPTAGGGGNVLPPALSPVSEIVWTQNTNANLIHWGFAESTPGIQGSGGTTVDDFYIYATIQGATPVARINRKTRQVDHPFTGLAGTDRQGIQVDGEFLYLVQGTKIWRAPLDGGAFSLLWDKWVGPDFTYNYGFGGLVLLNGYLYASAADGTQAHWAILRQKADGTGAVTRIIRSDSPGTLFNFGSITTDGFWLYIVAPDVTHAHTYIARSRPDGSAQNLTWFDPQLTGYNPFDVAYDPQSGNLLMSDDGTNQILYTPANAPLTPLLPLPFDPGASPIGLSVAPSS